MTGTGFLHYSFDRDNAKSSSNNERDLECRPERKRLPVPSMIHTRRELVHQRLGRSHGGERAVMERGEGVMKEQCGQDSYLKKQKYKRKVYGEADSGRGRDVYL